MDQYFNKLVKVWENGGGWGGVYYGVFSKIINDNNYKKCIEVGIGYGFHAEEILRNTKVQHLILIDPMKPYNSKDLFEKDVVEHGGFDCLYDKIRDHLKKYDSRYTWLRKGSQQITNDEIPDGSIDAVFIDGDHEYESVLNDLELYWKKIRKGGQIVGDDYWLPKVSKAVNEFAARKGIKIDFLTKPSSTQPGYKIYRFIK